MREAEGLEQVHQGLWEIDHLEDKDVNGKRIKMDLETIC